MSVALGGTSDKGVESDIAIAVTPICSEPDQFRDNPSTFT